MITIKADFNHLDGQGRLVLSDLAIHDQTPFEAIAASGKPTLFVPDEDVVQGRLVNDAIRGWCGEATGIPRGACARRRRTPAGSRDP